MKELKLIGYVDVAIELNKKTGKPYSRVLCVNGLTIHLSTYIPVGTIVLIQCAYDFISNRVSYVVDSQIVSDINIRDYLNSISEFIKDYYNVSF